MVKRSIDKFKIYKNVFDEFTIENLFKLSSQGHFDELISPVKIGKESNIFLASSYEGDPVIVKIYRLHSCNFNKMFSYIKSDPRFLSIKNQRRLVIFKWVQREYRNLLISREKINVPTPMAFLKNILVMESIGGENPAPQLKDVKPKDLVLFSEQVITSLNELFNAGLVHGDISEFNILNFKEKPYFIDFSQATSTKDQNSKEYLVRDIKNIVRFFSKNGVKLEEELVYKRIIKSKK